VTVTGTPAGRCVDLDCPVGAGVGSVCLLEKPVMHCPNFRPEAVDGTASDAPATPASSGDSEHVPEHDPSELSVGLAEPAPADDELDDSGSSEDGEPALRRESAVQAPAGPRRRVDFSEGEGVSIGLGIPLSPREAARLMQAEDARSIVLVGPPDCGKTTLLGAFFEMFCEGEVGTWRFAGSATLNGFMRRCWHARIVSGEDQADTPRTLYGGRRPFLHLRVQRDDELPITLIIADLAGDYFRDVASGADLAEAGPILVRAHCVLHLVDSGHFADPRDRQRARSAAVGRIRRLCEMGAFGEGTRHVIGLTRHDLCPPDFSAELERIAADIAQDWLKGAPVIALSARPSDDSTPLGLASLLDELTTPVRRNSLPERHNAALRSSVLAVARAGSAAYSRRDAQDAPP
jgi:hypothetical protein